MKSVVPSLALDNVFSPEPNRIIPSSVVSLVLHVLLFLLLLFGFDRQGVPEGSGETFHDIGLFEKNAVPNSSAGPLGSSDAEQSTDSEAATSSALPLDSLPESNLDAETNPALPLQLPDTTTIGAGTPLPTGLPSAAASRPLSAANQGRVRGAPGIGAGGGGFGSRFGRSDGTSFFQITAQGDHFYYVVDCSGSMSDDNAIGVARAELMASIERLDSTKRFQILFYNSELYPMLNGKQNIFFATDINRTAARHFINSEEPESGTMHKPALMEALRSAPNVIYFLTDGEQPELTPQDLKDLRGANRNNTQIHVVEFGKGEKLGRANWLEQLAKDHQGTYRYRNVTDFKNQ